MANSKQTLTKTEIISETACQADIKKSDAERAVNALLCIIAEALSAGVKVQLTGFGSLEVKTRKERTGVNPQTFEHIVIPEGYVVHFKAGSILKTMVNEASQQRKKKQKSQKQSRKKRQ